jgi:hypothetical protein
MEKLPKSVSGKVPSWLTRALNPSTAMTSQSETVRTTSMEYNGKEILFPTIRMINGKLERFSPRAALALAIKNRDYIVYDTPDQATAGSKMISGLIAKARKK